MHSLRHSRMYVSISILLLVLTNTNSIGERIFFTLTTDTRKIQANVFVSNEYQLIDSILVTQQNVYRHRGFMYERHTHRTVQRQKKDEKAKRLCVCVRKEVYARLKHIST